MSEPISIPTAQPPGAWRRLMRNRVAVVSMLILAGIAFVAIFGPIIFPYSPEKVTPHSLHPPSWLTPDAAHVKMDIERGGAVAPWQHPFGTDMNGRDVFSRVIQGARVSLIVGLCGALVSFFIGTTYGLIAGYVGGRTDNVMMRFIEMLHSVPRLIIVIVAIFTFGPRLEGALNHSTAFGLFGNNPRIAFTVTCACLWLVWKAAELSSGFVRARWLWVLALLLGFGVSVSAIGMEGDGAAVGVC